MSGYSPDRSLCRGRLPHLFFNLITLKVDHVTGLTQLPMAGQIISTTHVSTPHHIDQADIDLACIFIMLIDVHRAAAAVVACRDELLLAYPQRRAYIETFVAEVKPLHIEKQLVGTCKLACHPILPRRYVRWRDLVLDFWQITWQDTVLLRAIEKESRHGSRHAFRNAAANRWWIGNHCIYYLFATSNVQHKLQQTRTEGFKTCVKVWEVPDNIDVEQLEFFSI
jgi:hypothetical protein